MSGKTGGDRGPRHVRAGVGNKPGEHGQHGEREGRSR
jgi:hypothetical protein